VQRIVLEILFPISRLAIEATMVERNNMMRRATYFVLGPLGLCNNVPHQAPASTMSTKRIVFTTRIAISTPCAISSRATEQNDAVHPDCGMVSVIAIDSGQISTFDANCTNTGLHPGFDALVRTEDAVTARKLTNAPVGVGNPLSSHAGRAPAWREAMSSNSVAGTRSDAARTHFVR